MKPVFENVVYYSNDTSVLYVDGFRLLEKSDFTDVGEWIMPPKEYIDPEDVKEGKRERIWRRNCVAVTIDLTLNEEVAAELIKMDLLRKLPFRPHTTKPTPHFRYEVSLDVHYGNLRKTESKQAKYEEVRARVIEMAMTTTLDEMIGKINEELKSYIDEINTNGTKGTVSWATGNYDDVYEKSPKIEEIEAEIENLKNQIKTKRDELKQERIKEALVSWDKDKCDSRGQVLPEPLVDAVVEKLEAGDAFHSRGIFSL